MQRKPRGTPSWRLIFHGGLLAVASLTLLPSGCRSLRIEDAALREQDDGWAVSGGTLSRTNAVSMPAAPLVIERRWTRQAPAGFGPGSPVARNGVVYVGTLKGELVALHLSNGRGMGKRRFGKAMVGSPAVDPQTVYLSNAWGRTVLAAHDLRSGRNRWQHSGVPVEAGLLLADSLLIAADIEGELWGLSRTSGAVRWRTPGDPRNGIFASPVLAGHLVVAADDQGGVRALESASGRLVWQETINLPVLADLSSNGSDLFIATTRGVMVALRVTDGSVRWVFDTGDPLVRLTSAAIIDSMAVFGGSDGSVRALDAGTGAERWTRQISATVSAPPLIAGETVFIGAHDKTVYGFRLSDGECVWSASTEGIIKSAMAFHRGHLIVLSAPRFIHAFRLAHAPSPVAP